MTRNAQRPYKYASLESVVCLTGLCAATPRSDTEDAASQANRSNEEELQIALQTKDPDALVAYLEKFPDNPRQLEISEMISTLRRAEFTEWTMYETSVPSGGPQYLQISSVKPFEDKVAIRQKYNPDTA